MSLIIDNLRFAILTYFTLLALVFSNVNSVSAFEENEVRRENKRVWSIIKGKVKLDKSAYTVKRVRILTPKVELIKPPQLDEKKRISASKLYSMSRSYADYMTQKSEKNKNWELLEKEAISSIVDQRSLEEKDSKTFKEYLGDYSSS